MQTPNPKATRSGTSEEMTGGRFGAALHPAARCGTPRRECRRRELRRPRSGAHSRGRKIMAASIQALARLAVRVVGSKAARSLHSCGMMIVPVIGFATLISILLTGLVVVLLGWRRPRAGEEEGVALSLVFFFLVLLLASFAATPWLPMWGAVSWGVPWLGLLVVTVFAAVILVAMTSSTRSGGGAQTSPDAQAAASFGVGFWIALVLLLSIGIAGVL